MKLREGHSMLSRRKSIVTNPFPHLNTTRKTGDWIIKGKKASAFLALAFSCGQTAVNRLQKFWKGSLYSLAVHLFSSVAY